MGSFCFFITHCNAQTQIAGSSSFYLDSAGNDNNSGTISSPWKTIQKINSLRLNPGDKVLLRAGHTFKGTLRPVVKSNSLSNRQVLITSYGGGKAVINSEKASAIIVEKQNYVTIKNLRLIGAGRKNGNSGDGIAFMNCNNIIADDIEISGFRNAGLYVYTSSFAKLLRIYAHDNGFAGISVSGEYQQKSSCSNIYIGYCNAENNPGSPVILDNHSGNGIIAGSCSKLVIEYCTATNNGWDMPRIGNGPVGIWCFEADSVVVQHCISYKNKTSAGGDDGGGFDFDGGVTNSVIQYCLSYGNQGSGFGIFQYAGASPWHNNTIRYNISENDGLVSAAHAGIYIWNSSDDAKQFYNCIFYNNTIYNSKGAAINFAGQSERKSFSFYNNIFVGGDSLLKGKRAEDTFLANNWWSLKNKFYIEGIKDFNKWAKKSGREMIDQKVAGLNISPRFRRQDSPVIVSVKAIKSYKKYRIPPRSPLREKGLDLQSLLDIKTGGFDFNGSVSPSKGMGACF